jgi:hypothetical protein
MNEKLQTKAFEIVAPMLRPEEKPLAASRAMVGKFASGRLGSIVKQGLVLEGAGALGAALITNSKQFVVVTNHRLIFLPQTFMGGPGKKVLGEIGRGLVSLAEVKMGVVSLVRVAFGTAGDGVALTFPRVDKKNAAALAEALKD